MFRFALVDALRGGYGRRALASDVFAGITVALVALPLAIAFGIASLPPTVAAELQARGAGLSAPTIGLHTAIVAGLVCAAFGGSRLQVSGPTGAFVVIVYGVAAEHGYAGLLAATLLAGVMLVVMALCRAGAVLRFIPDPVVTGFTAGIAVVIATAQLPDLLGLRLLDADGARLALPPDFVGKIAAVLGNLRAAEPAALAVGGSVVAIVLGVRRFAPRLPGPILAIVAATAAAAVFGLPVETVGSRFGALPSVLPTVQLPPFDFEALRALVPAAGTIAMLCAIESLLSATVADGMRAAEHPQRHHADTELLGQGIGNVAVALCGGLPATGAIARTATNVRSGGRSPVAAVVHALTLMVLLLAAAPLAERIPLAALSGLLLVVAWNMAEPHNLLALLRAPRSDVAVLLATFALTVLIDLTVAVGFGMVAASLLFMKRMADVGGVQGLAALGLDEPEPLPTLDPATVPAGVEVLELQGPFFFGVADLLLDVLGRVQEPPRAFVLRMRQVPAIDATGLHALELFVDRCRRQGSRVLMSGVRKPVREALRRAGVEARLGDGALFDTTAEALAALA